MDRVKRIPKLKYFYLAMTPAGYQEFERTRQVLINQPAEINIVTGEITKTRPFHYLYAQPTLADTRFRQLNPGLQGSVYVLRIPAASIPRASLEATEDPRGMWLCRANLDLAHCGVERFDVTEPEVRAEVFASSRNQHAKNHNHLA